MARITSLFASPVPLKVGVVSLVISSSSSVPVSLAESTDPVRLVTVSTVILPVKLAVLPAISTAPMV